MMEKSAKKDASVMPQSDVLDSSDDNSSDFNVIPHSGVPAHTSKKGTVKPLVSSVV